MADDDHNDDDLGIDDGPGSTTGTGKPKPPTGKPVDEDDKGGEGDEWTPPTKAEWERQQRALATASREAKDRKEKLRTLQQASEDADGKMAREQAEAAEAKFKPVAVRAAAKAAFLEAGLVSVSPEKLAKLTRMLDLDAIEVTDDGDVEGLDDQVTALKAEFPEMFGNGRAPRAPRMDSSDRRAPKNGPKSSAQLIADRALSGMR